MLLISGCSPDRSRLVNQQRRVTVPSTSLPLSLHPSVGELRPICLVSSLYKATEHLLFHTRGFALQAAHEGQVDENATLLVLGSQEDAGEENCAFKLQRADAEEVEDATFLFQCIPELNNVLYQYHQEQGQDSDEAGALAGCCIALEYWSAWIGVC